MNEIISPATEFLKKIKGKTLIIHDYDTDGCCSAAILSRILNSMGIENELVSSYHQFSIEKISIKNFRNIIFCDIPEISLKFLEKIKRRKRVLIIDHHKPIEYKNVVYCNPRILNRSLYLPTTFLTYKIAEKLKIEVPTWIAACGILADRGVKNCKEVLRKLKKEKILKKLIFDEDYLFDKTKIGKITKFISNVAFYYLDNSHFISKKLAKIDYPEEIMKIKKFIKINEFVERERKRILKKFKDEKITIGKILFFEFESKLNLKSLLASLLARKFKNKVIFVAQKFGNNFDFSLREGKKCKYHLGKFAEMIKSSISNSTGGGHERAASGRIPYKYKKKLLEFLKSTSLPEPTSSET